MSAQLDKQRRKQIIQDIVAVTPCYPFKGIERFYDISGFLKHPSIFRDLIQLFVERYRHYSLDWIGGIDARGFILGPPLSLALNIPFFMLRKKDKLPNSVHSQPYEKEYQPDQDNVLSISRDLLLPGQNILLLDDLVATGGTLSAAVSLIQDHFQAKVVECACVIHLQQLGAQHLLLQKCGYNNIIWSLLSETDFAPHE